jgi:hypothetical protein
MTYILKALQLAGVVLFVTATACARHQPTVKAPDSQAQLHEERVRWQRQVETWGAEYVRVLNRYQSAENNSDLTKVVESLKQLAESAPTVSARDLSMRNLCIASAAAGDGVTLAVYGCMDQDPLRRLVR